MWLHSVQYTLYFILHTLWLHVASFRTVHRVSTVDLSWGAYLLGGWQEGCSRDGLVNDNFSAFAVKLRDEHFEADNKEIEKARFFEWRPLLREWRNAGRPKEFSTADGDKFNKFLMPWLDTYAKGQGLKCTLKSEPLQGDKVQKKVLFGSV